MKTLEELIEEQEITTDAADEKKAFLLSVGRLIAGACVVGVLLWAFHSIGIR